MMLKTTIPSPSRCTQTGRVFFRSLRCVRESARLSGGMGLLLFDASDADEAAAARFQQLAAESLARQQLRQPLLCEREFARFAQAMIQLA